MERVTKANPCAVCGKSHWCVRFKSYSVCMRVQSDSPKHFVGGEVGWIHPIEGVVVSAPLRPVKHHPCIDVSQIMRRWSLNSLRGEIVSLAKKLGVSKSSLEELQFVQTDNDGEFGIPMRDGLGNYIGIRVRHECGKKWAVPGSHSGIFIPNCRPSPLAMVLEGPTDTAAALTLGYYGIGRPSCCGGLPHIISAVNRLKVERVVIVADNDDPGIRGAKTLQIHLPVPSCVLVLPCKDLREFIKIGTRRMLDDMIDSVTWTVPKPSPPDSSSSH